MYSLTPIELVGSWGVFWFLVILSFLFALGGRAIMMAEKEADQIWALLFFSLVAGSGVFAALRSPTQPANVKVECAFKQYVPAVEKSGKSTTSRIYATFDCPEGEVILAVPNGSAITPQVILYRN